MSDKKTLGPIAENWPIIDSMVDSGLFAEQQDAAKFAMSLAIREGLEVKDIGGGETKWNVGTFDPDNSLRDLIELVFPEVEEPYRHAERLFNLGLQYIGQKIDERGGAFPRELIIPD